MKNFFLISIFFICISVFANLFSNKIWYYNYKGTVGKNLGRLVLIFKKSQLLGELYFNPNYKKIYLRGKIRDRFVHLFGKRIILNGKFVKKYKNYGNNLQREVLEGTLSRGDFKRKFHFLLSYKSFGNINHKYEVAGFNNDEKVNMFAENFKKAVISQKKRQVASMLCYPTEVSYKGNKIQIKTKGEFLKLYDNIFYPKFISAFKKAVPYDMFANFHGVMMSSNDNDFWIWFGKRQKNKNICVLSVFSVS